MGMRKVNRVKTNSGSTKLTAVRRLRRALRRSFTLRGRPSAVRRIACVAAIGLNSSFSGETHQRRPGARQRAHPRHAINLLSQPGAEPLVQLVLMVGPELD